MCKARGKLSRRDVEALMEVHRMLTMPEGTANFGQIHPMEDDPLPKTEAEVTEFIRRRTRLWRQSWILPVLEEMIGRT